MQGEEGQDYFENSDKTIRVWIEQETSIQIKAITEHDDPVELSESEALELAEVLRKFASLLSD
ncbi:hypothetical protein [Pseudomonas fluorescens]|jgi:hypothetical protein|uniref:hypothetical protein n=1 Tax=Pseudomonas fluorescens TaxID=294 RepID=UPI000F4904C5|nr:hypothetical protein [Pseudomonas fluorescens]RON86847.1 hypothetical protein BK668_19040 [Pseudomonas fluorescens]